MDSEAIEESLRCFKPALPQEAKGQVIEELEMLITRYRERGCQQIIFVPLPMANEPSEAHEARFEKVIKAPRKRGRPGYIAQHLLVFEVRDLLGKNHCNYGIYKDGDPCPLVDLLQIVDRDAGMPRGDIDWRAMAERYSDPFYEMKLLFGDGFQCPKGKIKVARALLRQAMAKAYKGRG